jgi:uncharacterized protein YecE (DUF72 family)
MEFGKITELELDTIPFHLPPDPPVTTQMLSRGTGNTKFFIGCAKWGRKDWIGKLYPAGTKEKDFLRHYGQVFNSIEFNGFFYNLHSREQVQKWADTVPDDFLFCPKFTQYITHVKRLKEVRNETDQYLDVVSAFGKKLGPIFLLPHPQMGLRHLETLKSFIADVPKDIDLFLELRSPEWYQENGFNTDLYEFLAAHKRGTVITDAAGRRDCVHMHLSTPECFIRFVGNSLHKTDYTRIDEWVERIGSWMEQGLERCYFFMHQHEELHSPELIDYFIKQLNKHCGTSRKAPFA